MQSVPQKVFFTKGVGKHKEKLIGIISIGDVVKQYIVDKEFTIQQLENYIAGGM